MIGEKPGTSPVLARNGQALVITTNFPPDASVGTMRTLRIVRQLAREHWGVDVLTLSPERYRPGTIIDPTLMQRVPSDVQLLRPRAWRPLERLALRVRRNARGPSKANAAPAHDAGSPPTAQKPAFNPISAIRACFAIPDREISWLLPAIVAGRRRAHERMPDVIYSSGPPFTAHLAAAALARLLRKPWVADFRDPWARAPWRDDRWAFEKRAWSALERAVVRRADAVVFVTDTNRAEFAAHYGETLASRFSVIPNGCDVSDFAGLQRRDPDQEPFVLLHAGSLYGARNPAPLLHALSNAIARGAIAREQIRLKFVGRVGVPGVGALVRELGMEDVIQFVAHVPRAAVLQEMVHASALLIVQPVTTVSIPAKLYEYLAAGRPILALAEPGGETAGLITSSGAGVAVRADDVDAIERALVSLVGRPTSSFTPVERGLYDGALRAQEVSSLLARLAVRCATAPVINDELEKLA